MKIDPTQSVKNQVKNYVKIRKGLRHSLPFQHGGKKCQSCSCVNSLVTFGFRGTSLEQQLPKLRRKAILVNVLHILDVVSSENRKKTFRFVLTFYRQSTDRWPTGYWHITNCRPTVGWLSAGRSPIFRAKPVGRLSANCWPTDDQQLADGRSTDGQQSADRFFGELFFTITISSTIAMQIFSGIVY